MWADLALAYVLAGLCVREIVRPTLEESGRSAKFRVAMLWPLVLALAAWGLVTGWLQERKD